MATSKFYNILEDIKDNKLAGCYKKYQNKDDANLPNIVYNLSYYPKEVKKLIEERDQNCVDRLTELLLDVLKNQSTSGKSFDNMICYYTFKREYGDSTSRSTLGQIYRNMTRGYDENGNYVPIKNDGGVLIKRIISRAMQVGCLPSAGVEYISTLMERAKFIAGRKPNEMTLAERHISSKMFNNVILSMKITMDNGGPEPEEPTYDYSGEIYTAPISTAMDFPIFDYHCFEGSENINVLDSKVNHFGVEGELDFKSRANFSKCIRELIKAGIMFNEDNTAFNIIPMYDGSIRPAKYPCEIIFAADTLEGITKKLEIAKAIFRKYDVNSSSEANHSGIHITQDLNYLKGNAFYMLANYVVNEMPMSEYLQHTKRQPNGYCDRTLRNYAGETDGKNHILDMACAAVVNHNCRYCCLNVTNAESNRLEGRMFNSCCDPVECINWINTLNETFNAKAKAEFEAAQTGKVGA